MKRVLLLIPTSSYRTQAFLDAGRRLGVEITVGSERPNVLTHTNPTGLLTVSITDNTKAAATVTEFAKKFPIDAVIGVDDQTTVTATVIAEALSLQHNSISSVKATRNKYLMRELLRKANVFQPHYIISSIDDDPKIIAQRVKFPCVLKPLILAGSRGVIRANNGAEFVQAFHRVAAILRSLDVVSGSDQRRILVEDFISGTEIALEGLLVNSRLKVLAIFDKPNPLDGPFFEETIYVSPSRLPQNDQQKITVCVQQAVDALGLLEGPIHAELRINEQGIWMLELAARSIGGYCSRSLRFTNGPELLSLEELILRRALGMETNSFQRESNASGVMMIPIPRAGILKKISGVEEAKAVPGVVDILFTTHIGQQLVPLPEGSSYIGFIFCREQTPHIVEERLRVAHNKLKFEVESTGNNLPDRVLECCHETT